MQITPKIGSRYKEHSYQSNENCYIEMGTLAKKPQKNMKEQLEDEISIFDNDVFVYNKFSTFLFK